MNIDEKLFKLWTYWVNRLVWVRVVERDKTYRVVDRGPNTMCQRSIRKDDAEWSRTQEGAIQYQIERCEGRIRELQNTREEAFDELRGFESLLKEIGENPHE